MIYELDPVGFPLLRIERSNLWVQWLPMTKIQFEEFLCATGDSRFDARWYQRLLELNPRISPHEVRGDNYWQALLSGILPHEAQSCARWFGEKYRLPTDGEWREIHQAVKSEPFSEGPPEELLSSMTERKRELLNQLSQAVAGPRDTVTDLTLADRMLMRGGVMEWVVQDRDGSSWAGRGETPRGFHAALYLVDNPDPAHPNDPTTRRLEHYGFRLVRTT